MCGHYLHAFAFLRGTDGLPPAISFPDANDANGDAGGGSSGIDGSMPFVFSHPRDDPYIFRGHARTIESSR